MTKTLATAALYAAILLGGATAAGTWLTDTCPTTPDLTTICTATADLPLLGP